VEHDHSIASAQPDRPPESSAPTEPAVSGVSMMLALQRSHGNAFVGRMLTATAGGRPRLARAPAEPEERVQKDDSARFEGDAKLEKIEAGSSTLAKGATGLQVTKLQQALVDAGYKLPKHGVDGKFGAETEAALKQFQTDAGVKPPSGVLDQATLAALNAKYDTRQPNIANATFDPANPDAGTRKLSAGDAAAVHDALVPQPGKGKSLVFQDVVAGKSYGDEIRADLTATIKALHKDLYEDKAPLRKDPKKNFHEWSTLEGAAAASKTVTDKVYGSYTGGGAPPMTHSAKNFVDQWEDEEQRNAKLNPADLYAKARGKVEYLISANCAEISEAHSAVPSRGPEQAILKPIIDSFVDTPAKVQIMLDLETGWEGAQLEGVVYLQRYKEDTDAKNRAQMWELFHTCIHEYLHTLAHPRYNAWANKQDDDRRHTLIEGFCDFFTENVRSTLKVDLPMRVQIEGPYHDPAAPVPAVSSGVYPSIAQAEQVVSIAGVRNAQSAYFRGEVEKLGGA